MNQIISEMEIRRAKRALSHNPVPRETIDRLLAAAILAPSCANNQSWRFIVIDKKEALESVAPFLTPGNYWVKAAPLLFLAITRTSLDCTPDDERNYAIFDTGLASMNLMLQATKEGLIAHPIAGFSPAPIKKALGIPDDYTLITIIVTGFPGDPAGLSDKHREGEISPRMRKPLSEVVCFNEWSLG
jgi:nitroreductase